MPKATPSRVFPTIIVDKINFTAELPEELCFIIRVKRCSDERQIPCENEIEHAFNKEAFMVDNGKIYFSGSFNRWWIVRVWQKLKEKRKPMKYEIEYCTAKIYKQLNFVH